MNMITISDIIDAKNHLIDRYNSPEYIQSQLKPHISELDIRLSNLDKNIAMSELIIELMHLDLRRESPTSPVNAKE